MGEDLTLATAERVAVLRAVAAAGGNISRAALLLGIDRRSLYRRLHALEAPIGARRGADVAAWARTRPGFVGVVEVKMTNAADGVRLEVETTPTPAPPSCRAGSRCSSHDDGRAPADECVDGWCVADLALHRTLDSQGRLRPEVRAAVGARLRRERPDARPTLVAWPRWAPKQRNACADACDMWSGPCCCGATHREGL